ncbi:MAG: tyrosine-type recombinase/integrase [Legionellales bacterium]|nr:tyrosine-type recombinase/integrase [Legionellales bacterium]
MPRKRLMDKHLPERVYRKSGSYYYVSKENKWIKLGSTLPDAMMAWADLIEQPLEYSTMNNLFDRYMLEVAPSKSPKSYQDNIKQIQNLRKAFGHMSPSDITPVYIYKYLDVRGKIAPVAANREKSLLSHIFTMSIRWGAAKDNPCSLVKNLSEKRRKRYVTDEEINGIKKCASAMMGCVIDFAYLTGLRQQDIRLLEKQNLKEEGILVTIKKVANTTGQRILIEWNTVLKKVIETALSLPETKLSKFVFPNSKGKSYTDSGFQTMWHKLMRNALATGYISETFHFHDIRRKTATDLEATLGREEARRLLGHNSQTTTAIYISGISKVVGLTNLPTVAQDE